ncbi:hypothetical protein CHS0354_004455 [Potamilus streckersoni]|uniref:R3H domain-containing protein n=1 Tax=Potamilus streckersoni TaxID=2493646 RepID=A0AAE0VYX9_9BIVA|nr:hypothetical protein CHS0354_004455 [Potamilus streckersoni]
MRLMAATGSQCSLEKSWRSFRLALYLDYRYLSSADASFVDLIQSDVDCFLKTDISDRVLIFPPIKNYYRFLIHKVIENEYPTLKSFSVGEGDKRRTAVCLKTILKSDWLEEQSMSAPNPLSRGRGRCRHRDDGSPSSSPFEKKSLAVGGLLEKNSKSVEQLQMEMRTAGVGRGRARPDRSKVKRPDAQMYVPPSRRQQQQQEVIQEVITPDSQKSAKPSHGKTKSGVQKYVHPQQKSVQEKTESAENLEDSIKYQFVENSRVNETYQTGNMEGVQPIEIVSGDKHEQKNSCLISQSDEWSHSNKIDTPLASPKKTVKKQKTSHQQKCSYGRDTKITEGGDAEHGLSSGAKEEKSKHSGDLDASFEQNKNVNTVCLSDTHLPNRNQILKVNQDRTKCDTEIDSGFGSVQFLAQKISTERNMETCVCFNTATSENASDKLDCIGNSQITCISHRSSLQFSNKSQLGNQQKVTNTGNTVSDQFAHCAKLGVSTKSDANKLVLDGETVDTTISDGETVDTTISDGETIDTTISDVNKVVLDVETVDTTISDGETIDTTISDVNKVVLDVETVDTTISDGETIDTTMSDANKLVLDGETIDTTISDANKEIFGGTIDTTIPNANKKVLDGQTIDTTISDTNKKVFGGTIDTTVSDANKKLLNGETVDSTEYSFHSYSKNSKLKGVKDSLLDFSSTTVCDVEKCEKKGKESDTSQIIHLDQINDLNDLMELIRDDSKITTDGQDSLGTQACSSGQLNEEESTDHILTVSSNQDPEQHSKCKSVINKEIHFQNTFSDIKQLPEVIVREQAQAELESRPADEVKQIDGYCQVGGKTIECESYTDDNGKTEAGGQTGDRTYLMLGAQEKKIAVYGNVDRSDVQRETISEDDIDEDSWDTLFDEDGECLDPKAMDELTKAVGKVKIEKAKINYLEYSPREPQMNYDSYSHIIEIYDFPKEFITRDLIAAFQSFLSKGFDIKWVDDTHALGVFSSAIAAQSALSMIHPLLKVCPLSEASQQSKLKVKRCTEFLQPYKPRPESSAAVARRLVTGALGLAPPRISKEKREQERKQLQEARAKKRHEKKEKEDMWEGTYGKCAMDAEPS